MLISYENMRNIIRKKLYYEQQKNQMEYRESKKFL